MSAVAVATAGAASAAVAESMPLLVADRVASLQTVVGEQTGALVPPEPSPPAGLAAGPVSTCSAGSAAKAASTRSSTPGG